ncbi:MAG: CoA pyrophosphatase [Spirochaetaceae bacterium]|nr:MAG: CoA pyrophosphatase [Spirochaetaceae bacterium]
MSDDNYIERIRRNLEARGRSLDYPFLRSAVIVPLVRRDGCIEIIFELRARHLRRSPGEVGFPGGRVEEGESPWQAALRELEEELGVSESYVQCLGQLPEQQRRRDELIVPFVGELPEDIELKPDRLEVEEVFTLPLKTLMDTEFQEARLTEQYSLSDDFPRDYLPGSSWNRTVTRSVHYLIYKNYLIWGLSANILLQLLERIR